MELFEIVIVLTGILVFYPGFMAEYPRYALLILVVILFETILTHYSSVFFGSNILVYNIYSQILIGLYSVVVVKEIRAMGMNDLCFKLFISLWVGVVSFRWIFFSSYMKVDIYSYVFGMIIVVFAISFLLNKQVVSANVDCLREPFFYLGVGVSLFFFSSFVLLLLLNSIVVNSMNAGFYQEILEYANLVLSLGYLSSGLCIIYRLRLAR